MEEVNFDSNSSQYVVKIVCQFSILSEFWMSRRVSFLIYPQTGTKIYCFSISRVIDLVSDPLLRRVGKVGGEGGYLLLRREREVGWEGGYLLPGREGKWVGGIPLKSPPPACTLGVSVT